MDGDDVDSLNASISWFDATAFDADCLPVESLDFGLLNGDVVPRDGMQRPFLTSGSPTHAPAARRGSKQPTHITHVHQTIIQSCIPTTTCAHIATTAKSMSGLSCLESALSLPSGSIHVPPSRWKNRSKAQTEVGIAPYVQDGAMAYGTRTHAQLQRTASDVLAGDEIDLLATPAPAHVHTPTILAPASTKVSQRVIDTIARNAVQHRLVQDQPMTCLHASVSQHA